MPAEGLLEVRRIMNEQKRRLEILMNIIAHAGVPLAMLFARLQKTAKTRIFELYESEGDNL